MDRERTRIENIGLRAVIPKARQLRLNVTRAYIRGGDLRGIISAAMAEFADDMAAGMAAAHIQGGLRSRLISKSAVGLRLSVYDEALAYLEERSKLAPEDIENLSGLYKKTALSATGEIGTALEREVQQAITESIRQGLPTRAGAEAVREAFDRAGVGVDRPYLFETIYRTQLQTAYSAGRWAENQHPAIQDILWGYEYNAVGDSRTTDLCIQLDGTRKPKDDPFWGQFTPPNHYGCRSQLIEIFNESNVANPTIAPNVQPQDGFSFNPGEVFTFRFDLQFN